VRKRALAAPGWIIASRFQKFDVSFLPRCLVGSDPIADNRVRPGHLRRVSFQYVAALRAAMKRGRR
jgi:hypothetical protein